MSNEDTELLNLAAKAAGYQVKLAAGGGGWINSGSKVWPHWDPLNKDGDALRLAVKLQISIHNEHVTSGVAYCTNNHDGIAMPEVESGHKQSFVIPEDYAATRRAIVLAAAQIGRSSQED